MPRAAPRVATFALLSARGLGSWALRHSALFDDLEVGIGARGASTLQESEARAQVDFPVTKLASPLVLPSKVSVPPGGIGHRAGTNLHTETPGVERSLASGVSKFGVEPFVSLDKDFISDRGRKAVMTMPGYLGKDLFLDFLPEAWALGIDVYGIVLLKASMHRTVFSAPVKGEPGVKMNLEITDVDTDHAERGLMIMDLVSSAIRGGIIRGNNIISVLGIDIGSHFTHFLYEEHVTLDQLFESRWFWSYTWKQEGHKQWSLAVPLSTSVPLIIDMLRGAKDLESLGVIHGHLSPADVAIVGGRRSAISGLIYACVDSDSQRVGKPSLRDVPLDDDALSSLFWEPPEVEDGIPEGASAHVWSIGLIFATMCFGANPVEALYEEMNVATRSDLYLSSSRSFVHRLLASEFNIAKVENFNFLDDDIKTVLLAMLNHKDQRWTTTFALAKMEALARSRKAEGVEVPKPRVRPHLPMHWRSDATYHDVPADRFSAPFGK